MSTIAPAGRRIVYPESDGQPMAENTLQAEWIVRIHGNLQSQFRDRDDVFVAMDNLWYPVEGDPTIRTAPDVYVAFGRPKGHRGSYRQWEEGGIAPQVVFEILSPGNRGGEMARKFRFYEHYGIEEYYIYDPDDNILTGFRRAGNELQDIPKMDGWVSPLLGIRFDLSSEPELVIWGRDGQRFLTFLELSELVIREQARAANEGQRAEQERQRAEQERQRADALAAKLRAAGIDPNA